MTITVASISIDDTHTSDRLRSRNFRWCWNSATNPCSNEEQWQNYTIFENEIIEDAFKSKKISIEVNGGYIIDFDHRVQYKKTDTNRQWSIKRYDLNQNDSSIRLRDEQFSSPLITASLDASSQPIDHEGLLEEHFPWAYYEQVLKGYGNTISNVVYYAAQGILKEGIAHDKEANARFMAEKLLDVRDVGEYIDAAHWPLEIPSTIGNICVNLYTANTFWYKRINSTLQNLSKVTIEEIITLGPFCYLLHYYLKDKMTTDHVSTVYRGVTLNEAQRQKYMKDFIKFTSFISTSKNKRVAEMFSGNTLLIIDLNVKTISDRQIKCGVDVSKISAFPDEEEFLIWPTTIFEFVKYEHDSNKNIHVLHLKTSVCNE